MSYEDYPLAVPLEGAELDRANTHLANALRELDELFKLVSGKLGRTDDGGFTSVGFGRRSRQSLDEPIDVTGTVFCEGGHCVGVYDAVAGVCRPCEPTDVCHGSHETLPE
jgi:hypothetical protein